MTARVSSSLWCEVCQCFIWFADSLLGRRACENIKGSTLLLSDYLRDPSLFTRLCDQHTQKENLLRGRFSRCFFFSLLVFTARGFLLMMLVLRFRFFCFLSFFFFQNHEVAQLYILFIIHVYTFEPHRWDPSTGNTCWIKYVNMKFWKTCES